MAIAAAKKPKADKSYVFAWEGMDRRGTRLKGETRASNVAIVRAELRRQGVSATKVRKKAQPLFAGAKRKSEARISPFSVVSWQP